MKQHVLKTSVSFVDFLFHINICGQLTWVWRNIAKVRTNVSNMAPSSPFFSRHCCVHGSR